MHERIAIDQIKYWKILLTWKITLFQTLYKTLKAATHSQNLWKVTEPQTFLLTPFHGVKEFPPQLFWSLKGLESLLFLKGTRHKHYHHHPLYCKL